MNYLLAQCRDYYLDVRPPETVEGFLKQLEQISEQRDAAPKLNSDEIQK